MTPEQRDQLVSLLRSGQELAPEWQPILFPPERRECELLYSGKERGEEVIADTMAVPLQRVRTFGRNGDGWHNQLIFGDNLQVMKTLLEAKNRGTLASADGSPGVRVVYIDPPFASKQEFRGSQDQKAYQDKIAGAAFIESIRRRLLLIRELLSPNGSLFFHTDNRKAHYLKVILDEVFGEPNFRNEIILPGRASKNIQQQFSEISRLNVRHDTLFWYSASASTRFSPLWVTKHKMEHPDGRWHHFWSNADRPTMRYKLLGTIPTKGQWTWKEERAKKAVANYQRYEREGGGRTVHEYWRDTGSTFEFIRKSPDDGSPQYWRSPADTRLADTVWSGVRIYNNSTNYPTEKHECLLAQILELASAEGDLVLDAFAGSGTTLTVAEKMRRRWIGIDSGKLSIYTVQKRILNLTKDIGNGGLKLKAQPFALYNAGLYDFATLRSLPWTDWRFFALRLFGCKDEPHRIGGMQLDGKFRGASVLVFNHLDSPDRRIDEETIETIHCEIGKRVGRRFFIVAPRGVFDFQQDYIDLDGVRYFALRIPYSAINELHHRTFTALQQASAEDQLNDIVEAVGFDFIHPPVVDYHASNATPPGELIPMACLRITKFESKSRLSGNRAEGRSSCSMVLLDLAYDGDVFNFDKVFFAHQLRSADWTAWFPAEDVGDTVMAVFIDLNGNEAQVTIPGTLFARKKKNKVSAAVDVRGST